MKNHINNYLRQKDCTGCTACQNICPVQCISMKADPEGFIYPIVDNKRCIECRICLSTCPVLNQPLKADFEDAYAMISKNDGERLKSSSGGIMSLLAKEVIDNLHGVVYGASYDQDFNVVHKRIDDFINIDEIRRAKYSQSDIQNIFKQIREDLKTRTVMFVGSPCQCSGLYSYLKHNRLNSHLTVSSKEAIQSDGDQTEQSAFNQVIQPCITKTENSLNVDSRLILVDFVCHSIPSPAIWKNYVNWKSEKVKLLSVNQRSKITGWSKYSYSIQFNYQDNKEETISNDKDIYMKLFIGDYISRPSCSSCQFKGNNRTSDLTLGDFWGIWDSNPEMDDDRGTSLVVVHSKVGEDLLDQISESTRSKKVDLSEAIRQNTAYMNCSVIPKDRESIFNRALNGEFDFLKINFNLKQEKVSKIAKLKNFFNGSRLSELLHNKSLQK